MGINRDNKDANKKVLKFLEKKKITFRQVMDVEGEIAKKFKVSGIPCTVLIDQKGNLQKYNVGFNTTMQAQLSKNIEDLLDGKIITSDKDDQFVSTNSNNDDEDEDEDDSKDKIEEHFPDRLTKLSSLREGINGYQFRQADLDGDGRNEFVLTDMWAAGCLKVLSSDGTETRMIKLEYSNKDRVHSFEPIHDGQTYQWFVAFAEIGRMGQVSDLRFGLFEAEGKQIWKYEPKLPKNVSVQVKLAVGDLDNDAHSETVVGLDVYTTRSTGPNTYTHENPRSYIFVFNSAGELLCCKKFRQSLVFLQIAAPKESTSLGCILLGNHESVTRLQLKTDVKRKGKKQI